MWILVFLLSFWTEDTNRAPRQKDLSLKSFAIFSHALPLFFLYTFTDVFWHSLLVFNIYANYSTFFIWLSNSILLYQTFFLVFVSNFNLTFYITKHISDCLTFYPLRKSPLSFYSNSTSCFLHINSQFPFDYFHSHLFLSKYSVAVLSIIYESINKPRCFRTSELKLSHRETQHIREITSPNTLFRPIEKRDNDFFL